MRRMGKGKLVDEDEQGGGQGGRASMRAWGWRRGPRFARPRSRRRRKLSTKTLRYAIARQAGYGVTERFSNVLPSSSRSRPGKSATLIQVKQTVHVGRHRGGGRARTCGGPPGGNPSGPPRPSHSRRRRPRRRPRRVQRSGSGSCWVSIYPQRGAYTKRPQAAGVPRDRRDDKPYK